MTTATGTIVKKPIFVSYRRTNEGNFSGLAYRLLANFGSDNVFIDQVVFRGGDHFAADLKAAVTGAEVVIAIIGPGWEDELAKRAESKDVDYVRVELETALAAEIEIVPVIVGREQDHITADLIPVSLRPLCGLHVVHLRQHNSMMADEVKTKKLIADLGNMPGVPRAPTDRKPPGHPPTPGRYPIEPAEINRLKDRIFSWFSQRLSSNGESLSVCVWGIPGMGKSTLVEQIACDDRLLEFYPDGVLFCKIGKDATAPQLILNLQEWARKDKLDIPMSEIPEVEEVKDHNKELDRWREIIQNKLARQRMLLVIDDVWDHKIGRAMMVGGKHCGYLFTTREKKAANDLGDLVISMPKLTEAQSLALLKTIAPDAFFEGKSGARILDHIKSVAQKVDGLPLALVLLGSTLKIESRNPNPARHLEQALMFFEQAGTIAAPPGSPEEITLAAAINASYKALSERRSNGPTLQRALCRLTALRPDPESFSPELAEQVIRDLQESEGPRQKPILDELTDSGLVSAFSGEMEYELDQDDLDASEKEFYSIHRTISDFVASHLSLAEKKSIYQSAADFFAERLNAIEKKFQEAGSDFRRSYRYESPAWQDAMDNWRFYLMIQGDYKTAALKFTHAWFCAFWWWGCFDNFKFCDELVRDWPTEGHDNFAAEKDQHELIQILQEYPKETGERRIGKSQHWRAVRKSLERIGVARQLAGDTANFDDVHRELRGLISVFLAETYRYVDNDFTTAETFYLDAVQMFEPRPDTQDESWNRPWVRYHLADFLFEAQRFDEAKMIASEALMQGRSQGDLEVQSVVFRLQADIAVSEHDLQTAIDKFNRSVTYAYAFQAFSDAKTENDPDGYTVLFYPLMTTRCSASLIRLYRKDPPSALKIASALQQIWHGKTDEGKLRDALESGKPDVLSAHLFAAAFPIEELANHEAKQAYARRVRKYLSDANFHFDA
jgi:NB-ARC domain/TIR domain